MNVEKVQSKKQRCTMRKTHKKEVARRLRISHRDLEWQDGNLVLTRTKDVLGDYRIVRDGPKSRKTKSRSWKNMTKPPNA